MMQFLYEKFEELRQENPAFLMPVYDRLRKVRPDWEKLYQGYDVSQHF